LSACTSDSTCFGVYRTGPDRYVNYRDRNAYTFSAPNPLAECYKKKE
jgi:hypothetical protein